MTDAELGPDGRRTTAIAAIRAALARHRFLRFLVAGGVNTAVGYLLFLAALATMPGTMSALVVSTVLAVLFNFLTHGGYVFRSLDPRRLWRFGIAYGVVFAWNAVGLTLLQRAGVEPWLGGLVLLPGVVAISYLINRKFVFAGPA